MGRHRHAVTVRADGLAVVLGALLNDRRVLGAVLVDVDSGMVLDACPTRTDRGADRGADRGTDPGAGADPAAGAGIGGVDPEVVGAGHAELGRVALALPGRPGPGTTGDELVVSVGPDRHHLLRAVPDPHGERLVLAVVVDGSRRFAERVRRKLRAVPVDALTAGPTVVRRPGTGGWATPPPAGPHPAAPHPAAPHPAARRTAPGERPAARGVAVLPAGDVRLDRASHLGAIPARVVPPPGGLFEPSPPGPVAPGGPGGDGRAPLPAPPLPAPFPVPPPPPVVARAEVPAAASPAPSLFTPGLDLRDAPAADPRRTSGPPPWPDHGAAVRSREERRPAGDPRPPAPPSALPPGRSG